MNTRDLTGPDEPIRNGRNGSGGSSGPGDPTRSITPGSGRRKSRSQPKGRQVDAGALDEVRDLLGQRSRAPDLLIEHLHLIQDRFGCLHHHHLTASR